MNQKKPNAFFSCSLNKADYEFNSFIEGIIKYAGFEPTGTVCKYTYSPAPIPISMKKEIEFCDCLIIAATPRYFQKNLNSNNVSYAMSEIIHVEAGMAFMKNIPILIFKMPNVDIGNFLPSVTQYIEPFLLESGQYAYDNKVIDNYFANTYKIIQNNWKLENRNKIIDYTKMSLSIIGGFTVLNFLFNNDDV